MVSNGSRNPYSILNVEKNCDIETAKKQFKKLAIIYHPDKLKHHLNQEQERNDEINVETQKEKKEDIDFVTLVWAYEQILKEIEYSKKSAKYENALNIKKKDLEYVKEEDTYIYFCRCGDFFLFKENLYHEYYIIYECQSCSSSVYLVP
ncbi:DnaJ protein, putative [Plasmodium ovale]|uniref:DnaJ protein, putative n=2 Tax=Plasmodium ovale TaxID=36330 RepID=A0A1A8WN94_PLAOA|nr:DnaJ protein, putative [Plasmodium ovale curtisi]SBS93324.1 DnaJ protein, putative [Plasmodium ovale curtisi]SCQ16644.1 DnaJ protein, putative [Plasmodium ovale]